MKIISSLPTLITRQMFAEKNRINTKPSQLSQVLNQTKASKTAENAILTVFLKKTNFFLNHV